MAAIREQVRQLHDLNEEAIEGHQRMLKRIDGNAPRLHASPGIPYRHVKGTFAAGPYENILATTQPA
ncbi:MAG: hypothetical protein Q9183_003154 [Haloplaca sp. 2 TL-2023]